MPIHSISCAKLPGRQMSPSPRCFALVATNFEHAPITITYCAALGWDKPERFQEPLCTNQAVYSVNLLSYACQELHLNAILRCGHAVQSVLWSNRDATPRSNECKEQLRRDWGSLLQYIHIKGWFALAPVVLAIVFRVCDSQILRISLRNALGTSYISSYLPVSIHTGNMGSGPSTPSPVACNGNAALCSRPYSSVVQVGTHGSPFVGMKFSKWSLIFWKVLVGRLLPRHVFVDQMFQERAVPKNLSHLVELIIKEANWFGVCHR